MKLFTIVLIFCISSSYAISQEEAQNLVEAYVEKQGYTEKHTSLKEAELEGSSFERFPASEWLKMRHNLIIPKAVAYRDGTRGEKSGWTFGFEFQDGRYVESHRYYFAVQISSDGKEILVLHGPEWKGLFSKIPRKVEQGAAANP